MLDISLLLVYHIEVVKSTAHMEQYRSGHNGHDWKSCVPQKGTEGSNPSCSARINPPSNRMGVYFIQNLQGFENRIQQSGGLLFDAGSTASTPQFLQCGNIANPSCSVRSKKRIQLVDLFYSSAMIQQIPRFQMKPGDPSFFS